MSFKQDLYSKVPNKSVPFLILFWLFSYLHGLIRTYTFIYFREKFSPTQLLGTTCLFIFGANSQLQDYSLVKMHEKEKEITLGLGSK